jgi:hypothetical protein
VHPVAPPDTEPVGAVEILRLRIYPLDSETADHDLSTSIVVEPGAYPLYRYMDAYFWMMTGRINRRGFTKIGDGLFGMSGSDEPIGPLVTFPSQRFGPEQLADLMAEPSATEGHPDQRLRFRLWDELDGGASA